LNARHKFDQRHVSLALQGGGAHGAFTWGVLDRLLEVEELVAEGICGTSAGAVNAVVLAYGLHIGLGFYNEFRKPVQFTGIFVVQYGFTNDVAL
jgi:hypothetical protein